MKNKKFWVWKNAADESPDAERVLELNGTIAEESWFDDDIIDVDHADTAHHTDLRRRQSDAARLGERLDHIIDQIPNPVIEFFNRAAFLQQNRVALFHDIT